MSMLLRASGSQLGSTAALLTCCSICLFLHPLPNCSITQNQKCGVLCGGAGILAMPRKCTKTLPAIWNRLPSTSTSGSVYMNAYYLCMCVCVSAMQFEASFRFVFIWLEAASWKTMTSDLQLTLGISIQPPSTWWHTHHFWECLLAFCM